MTGWMLAWILDGSWIDFWWILGGLGRSLGLKICLTWPILGSYPVLSYLILPYLILSYLTLVILGILATTVLPPVEIWGQQVSLGNTLQDGLKAIVSNICLRMLIDFSPNMNPFRVNKGFLP